MSTPDSKKGIYALRKPTHLARLLEESEWVMVECVLFGTSFNANKNVLIDLSKKFENMSFGRTWTSEFMNKDMQLLCSSSQSYVIWRNKMEVGRVSVKDRAWDDGTQDGKPSEVLVKLEQWINAVFAKQRFIDNFRSAYKYTPTNSCKDNITHLLSSLPRSCGADSWEVDSSGIMWVALRGLNLICLATMKKLDMEYVGGSSKTKSEEDVLLDLTKTIIFEIEAGKYQSDVRSFRKPYGIVSAMSGTKEVHKGGKVPKRGDKDHEGSDSKALSDICDKDEAINFLKVSMTKTSWNSLDDVIKTTILTLKCLCGSRNKKFTSKEIMVIVLDEKENALNLKVDIKKYLAAVNNFSFKHMPL